MCFFFFQAEDGIRDGHVTGVQTCALPISDGKNSFLYGLPFSYVTIYQENPNSGWFFDNFFNGNHGLAINPSTLVINVIIIYLLISFIRRLSKENSQKVML